MNRRQAVLPLNRLRHSRFNTRKTRGELELKRLAERIKQNGFEPTRALWVVPADDGLHDIFAGGTRYEAATMAELESVPVIIHEGLTDEEIARLADVDNENDEYHTPVSVVDVWAECYRLNVEEGWSQKHIAEAKGWLTKEKREPDTPLVSRRIKFHGFPDSVKAEVVTGHLDEGHLTQISGAVVTLQELSPWLTTEGAWQELAEKAIHDKGKNGDKTVRAVRDDVAQWKEFIAYAEAGEHGSKGGRGNTRKPSGSSRSTGFSPPKHRALADVALETGESEASLKRGKWLKERNEIELLERSKAAGRQNLEKGRGRQSLESVTICDTLKPSPPKPKGGESRSIRLAAEATGRGFNELDRTARFKRFATIQTRFIPRAPYGDPVASTGLLWGRRRAASRCRRAAYRRRGA